MFFLPNDIQSHIFRYDSTFHTYYKNVMKQLSTYGYLKRYSRNSTCLKNEDLKGSYVVSFSNSKQQLF